MSDSVLTLWKKFDPHVLTFAQLRVVFKSLRPPRDDRRFRFTLETNNLNYNLMIKKTLSVEKPSRDEAIKISPKQKFLKPILWMYY